ncbi:hypothetical protein JR316_0012597 [Psilocybe cubensis]|uniref:Uncharacterized protein n=2 Tax=Psilocybe cubensis TaxID=181762 RepID=A0ACB8GIY9_PSICU|nr:hypothetical protein JR316_0012597 [Psilocybe cubensis]KAH9475486.1 hypothetical protein JR316_0012597 [Psilocybe cubensis]
MATAELTSVCRTEFDLPSQMHAAFTAQDSHFDLADIELSPFSGPLTPLTSSCENSPRIPEASIPSLSLLESLSPITLEGSSDIIPAALVDDPRQLTMPSNDRRRARKNVKSNIARAKKRKLASSSVDAYLHKRGNPRKVKKALPLLSDLPTESIPVASTGYVALDSGPTMQKQFKLEELVGDDSKYKFRLLRAQTESIPIVDSGNRIIGVVANHPKDENWDVLCRQAADALESNRGQCDFTPEDVKHRRGKFASLSCGVSHGGRQQGPDNLHHRKKNQKVLNDLNNMECFKRFAGFATCASVPFVDFSSYL